MLRPGRELFEFCGFTGTERDRIMTLLLGVPAAGLPRNGQGNGNASGANSSSHTVGGGHSTPHSDALSSGLQSADGSGEFADWVESRGSHRAHLGGGWRYWEWMAEMGMGGNTGWWWW